MTEKRFVWIEGDAIDFPYFIDSVKRLPNGLYSSYHYDNRCDFEDIFDMLNELNNENEQLKVEYKELRYANDIYCESIDTLKKENEQLKHRLKKFQSKYDKSKTDEVQILVETENTVLLDKSEFEEYVRRHNELKRHNKRRKEKNRKYRNELKKRLREINGLKDFVQEDLCKDDKVLHGFIDEYL